MITEFLTQGTSGFTKIKTNGDLKPRTLWIDIDQQKLFWAKSKSSLSKQHLDFKDIVAIQKGPKSTTFIKFPQKGKEKLCFTIMTTDVDFLNLVAPSFKDFSVWTNGLAELSGCPLLEVSNCFGIPIPDDNVPWFVSKACDFLLQDSCLELTGIFRISGSKEDIADIRRDLDAGIVVNFYDQDRVEDPHVVSGLLKESGMTNNQQQRGETVWCGLQSPQSIRTNNC
eukprot:TRINITY_DN2100_c0_g1_i1.p1 TRINITY_DN2100_c0_g1~~TRINITY_DN2100_c0_g1_i1.p1  ORF type:complete len:254 (-),score=41.27 TRINITY_DN2100_c0_g1_i1:128-805(-)